MVPVTTMRISSGGPYEDEYGYCRTVRVGDQVFVSGTTARPPDLDSKDAYTQATEALDIVRASLAEAGASPADVVRTVAYVVDEADIPAVARAHCETFGDVRPTATLVRVAGLIDPALLVEFQVDAVVNASRDLPD